MIIEFLGWGLGAEGCSTNRLESLGPGFIEFPVGSGTCSQSSAHFRFCSRRLSHILAIITATSQTLSPQPYTLGLLGFAVGFTCAVRPLICFNA